MKVPSPCSTTSRLWANPSAPLAPKAQTYQSQCRLCWCGTLRSRHCRMPFSEIQLRDLRKELLHDVACHVGEPKVAALEAIGQSCVVEAEEAEDRGVEVVDVNGVFGHVPADFVGLANDLSAFDSTTGQPCAESVRV